MRTCLIAALLLAGCGREPGFDERYAATQQRLQAKAAEIDHEVAGPGAADGKGSPTSAATR